MDIFAYTSVEKDTSPLVLLSAMSTGLPIIAFRIDGIAEIITDGRDGVLVAPRDEGALARAIKDIYDSPIIRGKLGYHAREAAKKYFDLDVFAQNCEVVFRSVINKDD
jgi:glycosyltransferase involved in cell wall biosynthesis